MNFCVVILISCCIGTGFGGIITKAPRNVVALVGTTATLECCNGVSNQSLQWRRLSLNTEDSSDIYLGESLGFVDNFGDGRFKISNGNTSGCYNLIISDIQRDDAGTYRCADESDLKHSASASANVTILESFACYEVFPNKDVYMGINEFKLKPDIIQLMCSIEYRGRFIPEMQWKWQKSSNVSNFKASVKHFNATLTSTSIATFATFVAAKEFDRNEIMCYVQSPGEEDLSRNTVNWTSQSYRIKYAVFSNKEVSNCTAEELNLECNPPCSISSVGDRNFCEISFPSETSFTRKVPVQGEHEETPYLKIAVAVILTAVVVSLGFVIGIFIYQRKIRVDQKQSNELLYHLVKGICDFCRRQFLHLKQFRGILEGKGSPCYQLGPGQLLPFDAEAAATSDSSRSEHRQHGAPEENQPLSNNKDVISMEQSYEGAVHYRII